MKKWFRKRFVWATVEQACGEPLYWYQKLFRLFDRRGNNPYPKIQELKK